MAANRVGQLIVDFVAETREFRREVASMNRNFSRHMGRMTRDTRGLRRGLDSLVIGAGAVVTGFLSFRAAEAALGSLIETARESDRIANSLLVAAGSAEEAEREMAFVEDTADTLGLSLRSTARDYASLTAAAKGTVLEGEATKEIYEAVNVAMTALGRSSNDTSGALRAVEQVISKGTVQAEELRGQLGERLPGAFQLAARSIGMTTQELGKMLERGAVTAEMLLPALAAELKRTFSPAAIEAADKLNANINRLETSSFNLKRQIGEGGLSDGVNRATQEMSGFLDRITESNAPELIGEALGGAIEHLTDAGIDLSETYGPSLARGIEDVAAAVKEFTAEKNNLEGIAITLGAISDSLLFIGRQAGNVGSFLGELNQEPGNNFAEKLAFRHTKQAAGFLGGLFQVDTGLIANERTQLDRDLNELIGPMLPGFRENIEVPGSRLQKQAQGISDWVKEYKQGIEDLKNTTQEARRDPDVQAVFDPSLLSMDAFRGRTMSELNSVSLHNVFEPRPGLADRFRNTGGDGESGQSALEKQLAEQAERAREAFGRQMRELELDYWEMQNQLSIASLEGTEKRIAQQQFETAKSITEFVDRAAAFEQTEGATTEQIQAFWDQTYDNINQLVAINEQEITAIAREESERRKEIARQEREAREMELRSFTDSLERATMTRRDVLEQEQRQLRDAFDAGVIDRDQFARLDTFLQDEFDGMVEASRRTATEMRNAFSDIFFAGLQGEMADLGNIKRAFDRVLSDRLATGLFNSLEGTFGDSLPFLFGGGRADGGGVTAGVTYMVGERGPELFRSSQSGTIVPNHQLPGIAKAAGAVMGNAGGGNVFQFGDIILPESAAGPEGSINYSPSQFMDELARQVQARPV